MRKRRPCPDLRSDVAHVMRYVCDRSRVADSGCWVWLKHTNSLGYGEGSYGNRVWIITRLLYCATQGAFNPKLDILHSCDNPSCVNPDHLSLGTASDNAIDSKRKGRHHTSSKTHCLRGHPLSGDNLYLAPSGRRNCKLCQRAMFRIRHGWPQDKAFSMDLVDHGHRPINAKWKEWKPAGTTNRVKSECKRGHPLSGDNLYIVPRTGHRQCKACRHAVVVRIAAERAFHNGPAATGDPDE